MFINPSDCFIAFDKKTLVHLAEFYPNNFSPVELVILQNQQPTYVIDLR